MQSTTFHTFSTTSINNNKESLLQSLFIKRVNTSSIVASTTSGGLSNPADVHHHSFHTTSNNNPQLLPIEYNQIPAKILKITQETSKTKRFLLHVESLKTCHSFFVFFAGQYVNIHLGDLITSISISSPPLLNSNIIEITVQLSNHPISHAMHNMKEGEYIKVSGPLGQFYFNMIDQQFSEIKNLVLIAGGLGVTPLMSILKYIAQNGLCFVNVKLIYAATKIEDFCFLNDMREILKANSNIECTLLSQTMTKTTTTTIDGNDNEIDVPNHLKPILKHEKIDSTFLQRELSEEELKNAYFYLCGPLSMVRDVSACLQHLSVPNDKIKFQ